MVRNFQKAYLSLLLSLPTNLHSYEESLDKHVLDEHVLSMYSATSYLVLRAIKKQTTHSFFSQLVPFLPVASFKIDKLGPTFCLCMTMASRVTFVFEKPLSEFPPQNVSGHLALNNHLISKVEGATIKAKLNYCRIHLVDRGPL